jgi:hypothetical protein
MMMKTLRKLAAIFCALGMLVPSVAMATFGSTFGGNGYTYAAIFRSGNGQWKSPDASETLEAFSLVTDAMTGLWSTTPDSSGADSWMSEGQLGVREGDRIKDLFCMTVHPIAGADASTEVIFATYVIAEDIANGANVGAQLGTDWVFCTGGTCDTRVVGDNRVTVNDGSIINSRIDADGFLLFGFKSYTAGGYSGVGSPVSCTLVIGRG